MQTGQKSKAKKEKSKKQKEVEKSQVSGGVRSAYLYLAPGFIWGCRREVHFFSFSSLLATRASLLPLTAGESMPSNTVSGVL
jgi:hypothetical protein